MEKRPGINMVKQDGNESNLPIKKFKIGICKAGLTILRVFVRI